MKQKLAGCKFFWHHLYFVTQPTLSRYNLETGAGGPQPYKYSKSWVREVVPAPLKNSHRNFRLRSLCLNILLVHKFLCTKIKKVSKHCALNFDATHLLGNYPARWSLSLIQGPLHWSYISIYISNIQKTWDILEPSNLASYDPSDFLFHRWTKLIPSSETSSYCSALAGVLCKAVL